VAEAVVGGSDYARRLIQAAAPRWRQILRQASERSGLPIHDGPLPEGFIARLLPVQMDFQKSGHIQKQLRAGTVNDLPVWFIFMAGSPYPGCTDKDQASYGVVMAVGTDQRQRRPGCLVFVDQKAARHLQQQSKRPVA
jgi:hypothetical protein